MNEISKLRKRASGCGWALLIYLGILNILVSADFAIKSFQIGLSGAGEASAEKMMRIAESSAAGYHAAILTGAILLFCWKGIRFWNEEIWSKGKPMTVGDFLVILAVFMAIQTGASFLVNGLNWITSLFGRDILEFYDRLTINQTDSFSMYLYTVLLGPISEEILFRGLIQKTVMPWGKRLAILTSAFLFGIFHGNLVQTPYSFAVGLLLGYVAAEYSIGWSMVLHMFNNLVLSDLMSRLETVLPEVIMGSIYVTIFYLLALIGACILLAFRNDIQMFRRANPIDKGYLKAVFWNPGMVIVMVICFFEMGYSLYIG